MTERSFRFGLVAAEVESAEAWREKARRAEALGYDILLVPDHIGTGMPGWAPALMAAAAVTSRLRIGTFVLANDFRHPAFVAQDVATVDLLSDGRFELGLGAGALLDDYTRTGISWDTPGVKAGRLEEATTIVKGLLAGETVSFTGMHYALNNLTLDPRPVQRPRPPLMLAAGGRRMLGFAAREVEIISVVMSTLRGGGLEMDIDTAAVSGKIERVREAAGERFDQIELNLLLQRVVVTDDAPAAADEMSTAWETPAATLLDSPYLLFGTTDQIVATLQQRREQLGFSYISVFDRHADALNPVVERLAGT